MSTSDDRNRIMVLIATLAAAFLVAGALESTVLLSYIAVLFILAIFSAATIESHDRELDIRPFRGLIAGLGVLFVAGFTGIWFTWNPGMSAAEYDYIFGLPTPTAIFLVFIWFLPFLVTIYYAFGPFDDTVNDHTINSILEDARDAQVDADFPLTPSDESPGGDD